MIENNAVSAAVSARRADLYGYLLVLPGLLFVVENVVAAQTTGVSLAEISGSVLGLFAIGTGVLVYFEPRRIPRGTEPAPTHLYVLAGVSTLAFTAAVVMTIA